MDLDLRKLRYFVAVADRLHFGRAADDLHIAQPVLSRQIRALEHDLGTPLLTRDSHGVVLTDAGRQLLADGKKQEAMRVFQYNAKKYPNRWPVHVGLMRGYSALGDNKKALEEAKLALPQAPDEGNKKNLQNMIQQLEKGNDIN